LVVSTPIATVELEARLDEVRNVPKNVDVTQRLDAGDWSKAYNRGEQRVIGWDKFWKRRRVGILQREIKPAGEAGRRAEQEMYAAHA
jgi:hypothetical protein